MKILVFHQYYLMTGQAGGSRFNELARLWSDAGHQVTVIAGTVDYSTGKSPDTYRRRWITEEQDGPVKVLRCHVPTTYSKSYLGRMWAFFGFTLSAGTAALGQRDADVVIATSPPLITPIPAWLSSRLRRNPARWFFEIRDLWPESAVTTGVLKKGAALTRLLYRLEQWACESADRINVLTPAFRDDLVKRGLAPESKICFVPNGADVESFKPGPRENSVRKELGWGDRFVVMYAGAHGRANAVGQLIDAAELLKNQPEILIACVGDGPERAALEARAKERGLKNIVFHGSQPKSRMPAIVQACDVGAAVLQNNPTFRTVYPNKVFDYMACARPTLLAVDGVARKLVCDDARAGVFVEPENAGAIADSIRSLHCDPALRERLGKSGHAYVHANCTRDALAHKYLDEMTRPLPSMNQRGWRRLVKRAVDRAAGAAGLVASAPVMAAVAAAVRLDVGSPVLFVQERPGLHGRPFKLVKFRTMRSASGPDGKPLPDEKRLTSLGQFLRSLSLDELPQLWNVAKGELSLVGPRPLLMQYLGRYSADQSRRHDVLPGITGWAQVNGRNALSWDEKFALDTWYADNWSLLLDAKILAKTVWQVLARQGVSQQGHATMPEFMGSAPERGEAA